MVGVKRTTGQHPGGIVVIPRKDVHDFTQFNINSNPFGEADSTFAFADLHDNILKAIFCSCDPTSIVVVNVFWSSLMMFQ